MQRGRGRGDPGGNVLMSIPGCLICWEPIQQKQKKRSLGNSEKDGILFERLCSILKIDLSSSTWDFGIEAFPFCGDCTKGIQQLSRLQEKLEGILKEIETGIHGVKSKLRESNHKFISTDLRVIGFRSQALESSLAHFQDQKDQPSFIQTPIQFQNHSSHPQQVSSKYHNLTTTFPTPTYTLENYSDGLTNVQNTQDTIYSIIQNPNPVPTAHQTYHPVVYSRAEQDTFGNVGLVEVQVGFDPSTGNYDSHDMLDDSNDLNYDPSSPSANNEEEYAEEYRSSQIKSKLASTSKSKQPIRSHRKTWMSGQKKLKATIRNRDIQKKQDLKQNLQPKQVEQFSPIITTSDGRLFYENIEIMKNDQGTLYCGLCEYNKSKANTSVNMSRMKIHIKGVHLDGYKCATCGKNYTSREHLVLHEKSMHLIGVTLTPCEICKKPIQDFSNKMKIHLWSHKNAQEKADGRAMGLEPRDIVHWNKKRPKNFKCPKCEFCTASTKNLTGHLKSHLTQNFILRNELKSADFKMVYENIEITKDADGLVCGMCGYNKLKGHTIPTLTRMKEHIKGVHCGDIACDICQKKFNSKASLYAHKAKYHNRVKTSCEICQKPMLSKSGMKKHLWLHKNEEEKAESRALGQEPKKVINGPRTKNYKCEACGKLYRRPCELKQHMKSHLTSEKRYDLACPKCKKMFQSSLGLRLHFQLTHEPYLFTCMTCGKKSIHKKNHEIHIASCQQEYSCSICNRRFTTRSHLKLHSRNHRPAQDYKVQCEDCGLKMISQRALRNHQIRDHHKDTDTDSHNDGKSRRSRKSIRLSANSKRRYTDSNSESESDNDVKPKRTRIQTSVSTENIENNQNSDSDDSSLQIKFSNRLGRKTQSSRMSASTAIKVVEKYQDEDYTPEYDTLEYDSEESDSTNSSGFESNQDPDDAIVPLTALPNSLFNAETINIISDELVSCVYPDGKMHLVSLVPLEVGPETPDLDEQNRFDDNEVNYDSELQ